MESRQEKRREALLLLFSFAWVATAASLSAGSDFKLINDVLDAGGKPSQSALFQCRDAIGMPWETGPMQSARFKLEDGFFTSIGELRIASVSGRIVDYDGHDPLEGVGFEFMGWEWGETFTDEQGRYALADIPINTHVLVEPEYQGMFFQPPERYYAPVEEDRSDQDFVGSFYGDVSGNDDIQSYDASVVLRHVVGTIEFSDPDRDFQAADVSGNGDVQSYDASLILRYVVGIIPDFPVEGFGKRSNTITNAAECILRLEAQPLHPGRRAMVTIFIEPAGDVYSVDMKLAYDEDAFTFEEMSLGSAAGNFTHAHAARDGHIRIGMAGANPIENSGTLLSLSFQVNPNNGISSDASPLMIQEAGINEHDAHVEIANDTQDAFAPPDRFELHQNMPNPFNPETTIRYAIPHVQEKDVPQACRVTLTITNILGRPVRTLVDGMQAPGKYEAVWDARDDHGGKVTSGMYFCILKAGSYHGRRKMILMQ